MTNNTLKETNIIDFVLNKYCKKLKNYNLKINNSK